MKKRIYVLNIMIFCLASLVLADTQKPNWKGKMAKRDGIPVVQNPKKPMLEGQVLSLVADLSIGIEEDGEEYMFSRISGIDVDGEENIYVLDYTEAHLDVYDREGKFVRTIGRKGQGPGEMASPFAVDITKEREIIIQDLNNRQFLFFSISGEYLKSVSAAKWIIVGARLDSQDNIIGIVSTMAAQQQQIELKKFDRDLQPLHSFCAFIKPRGTGIYNPFEPEIQWALLDDDRIVCGFPEDYELSIHDPGGRPVLHIVRAYSPVGVTEEEIEEAKKRLPAPTKMEFPRFHSAYQGITADEEGRIFVQTWEKTQDAGGFYYDIFDSSGRYAARTALPFRPSVWKKGRVYTVEETEEGFQVVKRYKVIWKLEIEMEQQEHDETEAEDFRMNTEERDSHA